MRSPAALAVAALVLCIGAWPSVADAKKKGSAKAPAKKTVSCPDGMASVQGTFCIDKYEAHVVELHEVPGAKKGTTKLSTKAHSPFEPVDKLRVRAVTKKGVTPQGYISRDQAEAACVEAGKRLCTDQEWLTACKGKKPTTYPYGDDHKPGACNDAGVSSFNKYFGTGNNPPDKAKYNWANLNDPRLNQLKGTIAKTGSFAKCKNSYGVHDMVGNLHEWTSDPQGTFRGGYYLDTQIHGAGCGYTTTSHNAQYHDYSTGFRCCKG